jgi:hypothetical protein
MDSQQNYLQIPEPVGLLEAILRPSKFTALLGAVVMLGLGTVGFGIAALNSTNPMQLLIISAITGFLGTILAPIVTMLRTESRTKDIEHQIVKTRHDQKNDAQAIMLKQEIIEQKVDHIDGSMNGNLQAAMNRSWERVKEKSRTMKYTPESCDELRDVFDKSLREELASRDIGAAAAAKPTGK